MLKAIKSFLAVVDNQTYFVTVWSLIATYLCDIYEIRADLPSGLIGIAIIFPIVFSINAAYKRREDVLKYFASLKAHGVALYLAHSDWTTDENFGKDRAKKHFLSLLSNVNSFFLCQTNEIEVWNKKIFSNFKEFSKSHEKLRESGLAATEISRANQYLRSMMIEFEKMKNIKLYQTPKSLRAYSQIFLNLFPILYAPYFAQICYDSHIYSGYIVAFIYSVVLVTLDNIQEDLENPFDRIGEDDVDLDVISEYNDILA